MKQKEMRFLVPAELYKKYKMLCLEMDLSVPKQSAQLIEQFVKMQNDNLKIQKELKKMTKGVK